VLLPAVVARLAVVLRAVVARLAVVLPAVVGRLAVVVPRVLAAALLLVPAAVLVPEGFAGRVVFAAPAELARALPALRAGAALAAAFFVGGTDLPPIWTS
jgi:ABC-type phosphonate transport system ATPase subunit